MNKLYAIFGFMLLHFQILAQTQSPAEFLGYELGDRFTPHHKVVAYYQHVAATNDNVLLKEYGKTNELRPLMVAFVSSQQNIEQLETIRTDNLKRAGLMEGSPELSIPVHWMSYNVHGNEAVSSEATMMTLFSLVDPENESSRDWLANTLVVLDPCVNPDGQERYVNWYQQKMNQVLQPDLQSIEHREPWPGGRPNHYFFDLNRDWAWQTQVETQQRLTLYNEWLPQVHLDFHEQGINSPYYFAPAAEPLHVQLTAFQHEYQEIFGRNTAAYFDKQDWFYFTKERFDLLYPSYGDTYPMYNGAIGMTIEQGGSGRAGIGGYDAQGDTISLKDRIIHHHTTGISAIETTSSIADRVLEAYEQYFTESSTSPSGTYKSFVIKGSNPPDKVRALLDLLDKNGIRYGWSGKSENLNGFSYQTGESGRQSLAENDIVINAFQPKSVLTQVLFEPEPVLNDSITYDITSWALPYAFGLDAFALEGRLDAEQDYLKPDFEPNRPDKETLAYIAPWNATSHVKYLAALLQEGIRVRYNEYPFEVGGNSYPTGSLIITRGGNAYIPDFHQKVTELANSFEIKLGKTQTGYMDSGKDFGSSHVRIIRKPDIALVGGEGVSSLNFGEVWHFLDSELKYPVVILESDQLNRAVLQDYNVLIMPSGNYKEELHPVLTEWVAAGGKLLAMEDALDLFADREEGLLQTYASEEEKETFESRISKGSAGDNTAPFLEKERLEISTYAAGAIYEVQMDTTHPLGYGSEGEFYTLKNNSNRYALMEDGINAGYIAGQESHRTGFIGYKIKPLMANSMVFGVEPMGRGQLIYMVDNPMFRSFWEAGKLIFANAVFLSAN
ncbi:M14 family zinc carboxypeptidase [Cyclobacterium sp.]|uniref:M14 family zinc carboxypeptidase n=1 Tax=Cyclobacterium sp. TaxID=1966343 RepID=UPI0019BCCE45|nr:M14 family zinc carboxypeptidase [Cyclobacterium sp.]MBD3629786.1 zinc carboxypeptidase [Cyclobacterium sp.]